MNWTIWAVVKPNGDIIADSEFTSEAHAWHIALGWPDTDEIEDAKKRGYKAMRVNVAPDPKTHKPDGSSRHPLDIASDPQGILIHDSSKPHGR